LKAHIGERAACSLLGASRATFQRRFREPNFSVTRPNRRPPRKLTETERLEVIAYSHEERFCDSSIREIFATLLDEGTYVCSISTWYRVLRQVGETKERRALATHPAVPRPELAATAPCQVWTWDITKLHGPAKWSYYYLYVVIDIFSRYIVAWRLERSENAAFATELFDIALSCHGVDPREITVHADRGSPMTAKSLYEFFSDLGITPSHSRPRTSDDNPYIEAFFKTFKYGSQYPSYFESLEHGRDFCAKLVAWYNNQHHHTGIALLTPADVHAGLAARRTAERQRVLDDAWREHPERFVRGKPTAPQLAKVAYINPPHDQAA
jgi:putative transposase